MMNGQQEGKLFVQSDKQEVVAPISLSRAA